MRFPTRVLLASDQQIVLDFLPGEPIVVDLKKKPPKDQRSIIQSVDKMEEAAAARRKARSSMQGFYRSVNTTISSRVYTMSDTIFNAGFINTLEVTSSPQTASGLSGDDNTTPSLSFKSIYRGGSAGQAGGPVDHILDEIRRFRTARIHRLFHAPPRWIVTSKTKKSKQKKRRRREVEKLTHVFLIPELERLAVWQPTPRTLKSAWRAVDSLPYWADDALLRNRLRDQRKASRAQKLKQQQTPLAVWDPQGRSGAAGPTITPGVDITSLNLSPGRGAVEAFLDSAESQGVSLRDGPLSALMSHIPPIEPQIRKVRRGDSELRAIQAIYLRMTRSHSAGGLTHTTAVALLCASGRPDAALVQLETLIREGTHHPDTPHPFSSLLTASRHAASPAKFTQRVWDLMLSCGVEPNGVVWAARLSATTAVEGFSPAVRVYRKMMDVADMARGIGMVPLSEDVYVRMMYVAPPEAGFALVSEMRRRGVPRTSDIARAWLRRCEEFGDMDTAVSAASLLAEDGVAAWSMVARVALASEEFSAVPGMVMCLHAVAGEALTRDVLDICLRCCASQDPPEVDQPDEPADVFCPSYGLLAPPVQAGAA